LEKVHAMVVGGKGKGKPAKGQKPTKGGQKQFTNVRDLQKQQADVDNHWQQRQQSDQESSSEEEEEKNVPLIEVNNPNHVAKKNLKLGDLASGAGEKVELSRKERYNNLT
jgi:hypothetical protein